MAGELRGGPTVVLGDANAPAGDSAEYAALRAAGLVDALAPSTDHRPVLAELTLP